MNAGNFLTSGASQEPVAAGSVTDLKVFILAVCNYANACGYCVGRKVSI